MNEILKKISVADYSEFKKQVTERLGWTKDQFRNRQCGKTKLTLAEKEVINTIVQDFQNKANDD